MFKPIRHLKFEQTLSEKTLKWISPFRRRSEDLKAALYEWSQTLFGRMAIVKKRQTKDGISSPFYVLWTRKYRHTCTFSKILLERSHIIKAIMEYIVPYKNGTNIYCSIFIWHRMRKDFTSYLLEEASV